MIFKTYSDEFIPINLIVQNQIMVQDNKNFVLIIGNIKARNENIL